jgi:tRNA(Leu) C34 or U34 (ribose-2'-O)-methylase TrmL
MATLHKLSDGLAIYRQGKPLYNGPLEQSGVTPVAPAVVLHYAKYPHNVGQAVRILSCYGVNQLWVSGGRVDLQPHDGYRLPREERMKGYGDVVLFDYEDPLAALRESRLDHTPVAVELVPGAENLPEFVHPPNPVYIFGPEDGSLPGSVLKRCHRFIKIPTIHCLNLACAVGTVLYDRKAKL